MPVVFLTVRSRVEDLEQGLSVAGAGYDYVRKPAELRRMQEKDGDVANVQVAAKAPDTHELIAHIRARLPADVQEMGSCLRIDRKRRTVERRGAER
jgi:DNA-binding response OmpR family regulator